MTLASFALAYRRRLGLFVVVALATSAVDQASKLIAAGVHPHLYATNPSLHTKLWVPFIAPTLLTLLPSVPLSIAAGIVIGGAAGNTFDHLVWPGGIPDFIGLPWTDSIYNVADFEIWVGTLGVIALIAFTVLRWLSTKLAREQL